MCMLRALSMRYILILILIESVLGRALQKHWSDVDCFMYINGIPSYTGMANVTETGRTCQRWDTTTPHNPVYPMDSDQMNYCRTPDNDTTLWCYTMDPDTDWEYCKVSECREYGMTTVAMTRTKPETNNTTAETKFPVTLGHGMSFSDDCFVYNDNIPSYNGTTQITNTGRTCQRWDVTFPHKPRYKMGSDHMNYCRAPDNDIRLWCYTTDPDKCWEYCDVPECALIRTTASTRPATGPNTIPATTKRPVTINNTATAKTKIPSTYTQNSSIPEHAETTTGQVSLTSTTTVTKTRPVNPTSTIHASTRQVKLTSFTASKTTRYVPLSNITPAKNTGQVRLTSKTRAKTTGPVTFSSTTTAIDDCFIYINGIPSYTGRTNITVTGKTCQRWDTASPTNHYTQWTLTK